MVKIDKEIESIIESLKYILTTEPLDAYNAEFLSNMLTDNLCECKVNYGATKVCIIPTNNSSVIKIPFNRYVDIELYQEDKNLADEAGDEKFLYTINDYASPFTNATCDALDDGEKHWDYCRLETLIYEEAFFEGISRFFAQEVYYGEINGHPIYIQERATPIWDAVCRSNEESKRRSENFCKTHDIFCFDEAWIADFIAYYGEEDFLKLSAFIKKYEIDDLRRDNIGYIGFCPVLFDYSGFREW